MAKRIQRLFSSNPPPRHDPLSTALFVDREEALADGVDFLLAGDDFDPRIYAIHGDSRSGKSHLAQRILGKVEERFTVVELSANSMGTARMALERIFVNLFSELANLPASLEDADGLQAEDVLRPWRAWFQQILPLIEGHQTKQTVEVSREVYDAITVRIGGSRFGYLQFDQRETDRTTNTVVIEKPDDTTLVGYIRYLTDVVWYAFGKRPLLLYLDDLDLLTRRYPSTNDPEAEKLASLLAPVAESERVVVLASVRSLYMSTRDKAFYDYLRVRRFSPARLREIYDRQIEVLHDGEPIFTDDVLEQLLALAVGRAGVFLGHCHRLWRFARRETPIDEDMYRTWVEDELRELMRNPDTAQALHTVGGWLARNQVQGALPGVDPEDGPLAFLVIRPASLTYDDRVNVVTEHQAMIRRLVTAAGST